MKKKEILQTSMFAVIDRWKESGLSQKEFCKVEGLNYYKFKYWNARRKQLSNKGQELTPSFVAVSVPSPAKAFSGIELSFPNGVKLSIKEELALTEVKELINCF